MNSKPSQFIALSFNKIKVVKGMKSLKEKLNYHHCRHVAPTILKTALKRSLTVGISRKIELTDNEKITRWSL